MIFYHFYNISAGNSKARPVRKMSRSWTSTKSELKEKKVIRIEDRGAEEEGEEAEQGPEKSKNTLSSSSADPSSSSNANTNSRLVVLILTVNLGINLHALSLI